MPTPFQSHAATLADYLAWLNAQADGTPGSDPNSQVPVFTFKTADYFCNYKWVKQKYLNEGGFVVLDDLVLEVLEPIPDPGPAEMDLVTFQGRQFRVQKVQLAAGKNQQLTCWDLARGA